MGRGILIEASKYLKPWREAVVKAIKERMAITGEVYFDEPIEVWVKFILPRPKTNKSELPIVPPDVDKLERAVFDSLTISGLIRDDSLIVASHAQKIWTTDGVTGAYIIVESKSSPNQLA